MTERRFDDGYWDDHFVQSLPKDGKLLYAYLWTNKHCNSSGLYQITPSTIAFETKLAGEDIPQFFEELIPKVVWYRDENLIWVKNFIKKQSISPTFLVAVARCLIPINNNIAVEALIDYNRERYSLLIPYENPMGRVSRPCTSSALSNANKWVGVVKGEGKLPPEEREIFEGLIQTKGWQAGEDDGHWLQGFRKEFPGFTLAEFKACVDYHSGNPVPKHKGIWKNRFRNWIIKKQEFEMKGGKGEQRPRQKRAKAITYIRGSEEDPGKD